MKKNALILLGSIKFYMKIYCRRHTNNTDFTDLNGFIFVNFIRINVRRTIVKKENQEYFKVTYTMIQMTLKLKITSICFIKNNKAYLVTLSAEFDKYEQYKKIGEDILNSFRFIN